jgi:hypothetical protein
LQNVTIVVFSEFGRRVRDNGNNITEKKIIVVGNPDLADLDQGDLKT